MPVQIPLQNDPHAYDIRVELDQVRYLFAMRWNWRAGDWRVSIQNVNTGEWVATGRRLSPGSMVADFPNGQLHAFGDDPYYRSSLGNQLYVIYYTDAELSTLQSQAFDSDPPFAIYTGTSILDLLP